MERPGLNRRPLLKFIDNAYHIKCSTATDVNVIVYSAVERCMRVFLNCMLEPKMKLFSEPYSFPFEALLYNNNI